MDVRFGKLTSHHGYSGGGIDQLKLGFQGKNKELGAYIVNSEIKGDHFTATFNAGNVIYSVERNLNTPGDTVHITTKDQSAPVLTKAAQQELLKDTDTLMSKAKDLFDFFKSPTRNKLDPSLQHLVIEDKLKV